MNKRLLEFKGSHREIGQQVGEQYRKWGKREVYIPSFADSVYAKQLACYQKFFPQYLVYLEGVSEGLGISKDKVIKSYLTGFLNSSAGYKNECSALVVKNKNGVLIGRNYDWRSAAEEIASMLRYDFTDGSTNSFMAITDMATWKIGQKIESYEFVIITEDAWNDQGLYVSSNGGPENKLYLGMCSPHLTQCIVEQCGTVDQAIKLIEKIPLTESKIFTLADRNGSMAVVEKSIEKGTYVRKSKDFIFATNHYNSPALILENLSIFPTVPFHSTFSRYHYLEYNLLENGKSFDLEKVIALLVKPPTAQNWRGLENGDTVTVWTLALDLGATEYIVEFAPLLKTREIVRN